MQLAKRPFGKTPTTIKANHSVEGVIFTRKDMVTETITVTD